MSSRDDTVYVVVHAYMSVDFDIVWDVVTLEFPTLAAQLERLVPPLEN